MIIHKQKLCKCKLFFSTAPKLYIQCIPMHPKLPFYAIPIISNLGQKNAPDSKGWNSRACPRSYFITIYILNLSSSFIEICLHIGSTGFTNTLLVPDTRLPSLLLVYYSSFLPKSSYPFP